MSINDIVTFAKDKGMPVAGLTDVHTLSGLPEFLLACEENGIHGVAGLTLQVKDQGKQFGDLVLLAKGEAGYTSLKNLIDVAGHVAVTKSYNPDMGIELSSILSGEYTHEFQNCLCLDGFPGSLGEALIKREQIGNDVPSIRQALEVESSPLSRLRSQFAQGDYLGVKTPSSGSPLAGALTPLSAIDGKTIPSPGAIETSIAYAKDVDGIKKTKQWFKGYASEYLSNSVPDEYVDPMLNRRFDGFSLASMQDKYKPSNPPFAGADFLIEKCPSPKIYSAHPKSAMLLGGEDVPKLIDVVRSKWQSYSSTLPAAKREEYAQRLKLELSVIHDCGFDEYFLNIYKIQKLAEKTGNAFMLRGSAVASLVMNVIGMTEIDAIEEELVFDRFLRRDRIEEPDVDIEFVNAPGMIRSISDYFEPGQIALLSRGVGIKQSKVLLEKAKDAIMSFYNLPAEQEPALMKAYENITRELIDPKNSRRKIQSWPVWAKERAPGWSKNPFAKKMIEIANSYSTLINGTEVNSGSAVFIPGGAQKQFNILPGSKKMLTENTVGRIEQTKYNIGPTGHIKYDLLANHSFSRLILASRAVGLADNFQVKRDDPTVNYVFSRNAFLGVCQLNGYVGSDLAVKFKAKDISELTALNALIRDGGDSDLQDVITQYLSAKFSPESVDLPSVFKPILKETHGSLLYEEQLLRILTDVGGFEWGAADKFRSSLKKGKGEVIDEYEGPFIAQAMKKHGVSQEDASKWYQPLRDKRGRFVFNKAHAVAYAALSVKQCWLKCHYPAQYASELYLDNKAVFMGNDIKLDAALDDWSKIQYGRPLKANAETFINAIVHTMKRESANPDSNYKRNISNVKMDITNAINEGQLDFCIADGMTRESVLAMSNNAFDTLSANYEVIKHGVSKADFPNQAPRNKIKQETTRNEKGETVTRQRMSGPDEDKDVKPANRRKGYIDFRNKIMIGHLLQFLSEEGIITGLDVSLHKAAGLDHYRFNVTGKDGNSIPMHVAATSTDPSRAKGHNNKYSLTSGFYQGGNRDRKGTDTLTLAAEIANIVGIKDMPNFEFKKGNNGQGSEFLPNKIKKEVESAFGRYARKAKSPLYDVESSRVFLTVEPAEPTSPIMLQVRDTAYAQNLPKKLFEDSRKIDVNGMAEQFNEGHFSLAEVRTDKLIGNSGPKKRLRKTELLANYRKVTPGIPLHEAPLIEGVKLSPGGHQRFFFDKKKGRTTKIDLGFTTRRIRGHVCGKTTKGSDTLWLGEAAIDSISFNEMQRIIKDVNDRKGLALPHAEENCVAVRSAGGAADVASLLMGVEIIGSGKDQDFCLAKREAGIEPFDESSKKSIREWFQQKTIHWLAENTKENIDDRKRLAALMVEVGIPESDLKKHIVSHQKKEGQSFASAVHGIYDNFITAEGHSFLHTSNMDTWLRGSDLAVQVDKDGAIKVGTAVEVVTKGKPFSTLSDGDKKKVADTVKSRFEYMSGAKSLGFALDNDGAGKKDAAKVFRLCKQVGLPTGSLMPQERKNVKFNLPGQDAEIELKDHNDFLMVFKKLVQSGQQDAADNVIIEYASDLKLPALEANKVTLAHVPQTPEPQKIK